MPECSDKKIVDADGCLNRFEDWNDELARALAVRHGIRELSDQELRILRFIRDYYRSYNFFPMPAAVCKRMGEEKNCLQERFINALVAWKVAGLPHPEEPVVSLLKSGQSPG